MSAIAFVQMKGAQGLTEYLKKLPGMTDKVAASAANATAFDARLAMKEIAKETQAEGIEGMRIKFATAKNPQATLSSGNNWTEEVVSASLTQDGGTRAAGMFGGIRGNFVFLRGRFAPTSQKALQMAYGHGFFAAMHGINAKSKGQLGLFMRWGGERRISIFYRIKTLEQTRALEAKGVDVAEKNYDRNFGRKFTAAALRTIGGEG